MLQAELAGHAIPEALSSEDYLTSAAFGLLKYVDSRGFWENVFRRAVCVGPTGERIPGRFRFTEYGRPEALDISFWQRYDDAIPDLTVCFNGHDHPLVRVLIEVKLNAEKGDAGDPDLDQLVRYAKLAARLSTTGTPTFLIFLTPSDPVPDIRETLDLLIKEPNAAARIFGLQWGDLHAACLEACHSEATKTERQILSDVAAYLQKRNLDYFSGFHRVTFQELSPRSLLSLSGEPLFKRIRLPEITRIKRIVEHANE